jgi:hypothetical protein
LAVARQDHLVSLALKHHANELQALDIVIHDKDSLSH